MITLIARKDFLLNLLSVRFMIGFILCLVIIPFTMVVSVDEFANQMRVYHIEQDAAETELKNTSVFSKLRPKAIKQPEVLSVFSKGIAMNVGNTTQVNFGEMPLFSKGHTATRDNPLLNAFFTLDFATVIAIVISLLALVFSYDCITREREDGTMKLVMTNAVSRITFLIGKFMGLLLTLLPILLFCYLLACFIILINPGIELSGSDWTGIVLLFLTSLVYMFVFILLGLLISSLVYRSSSSIILCLLCWIGFLFIIPNMATYLSQSIVRTPLYDNVQVVINEAHIKSEQRKWEIIGEKINEVGVKVFGHWNHNSGSDGFVEISGGKWEVAKVHQLTYTIVEPERIATADRLWIIQKDYMDKLVKQQRMQQILSWLSPSEIFTQATDALCRTDMPAFLKYMESQREYRQTVIQYFVDNNLFSSFLYFTRQPEEDFIPEQELEDYNAGLGGRTYPDNWNPGNYPRLNTDNVPRYVYRMSSPMDTFKTALSRLAALVVMCVFLLAATAVRFTKYDVR